MSSSRMTSNQEVTIRLVLCAVGVPDFTGVEDIFRLTVGQSKIPRALRCEFSLCACCVLTPQSLTTVRNSS